MLELVANAAMSARADEECGAAYGERSPERTNSRNGYRERGLATSVGDVTLRIPKLRSGSFFPDDLIERYCRVDRALVAAVAEMHVMGGVHAQGGGRRRWWTDSNPRPADYKSAALPTELHQHTSSSTADVSLTDGRYLVKENLRAF